MSSTPKDLVKMSELARMSDVPAATIKHYIREGLLPEPALRTSRNMAWYDPRLVPRIQAIKELQRTRFLPLKVIREVLDGAELEPSRDTMAAAIARVLGDMTPSVRLSRAQVLDSGVRAAELDGLIALKLLTPDEDGLFGHPDLELLSVLKEARQAGLNADMLPYTVLARYVAAIQELVRAELELFRSGVLPAAGDQLGELSETATRLSERLVVILRRKMLLPTLQKLFQTPENL